MKQVLAFILLLAGTSCFAQITSVLDSVVKVNYLIGDNDTAYISGLTTTIYEQGAMVSNQYASYNQNDSVTYSTETIVKYNEEGFVTDSFSIQNSDTINYYLWQYDSDGIKVYKKHYAYQEVFGVLMINNSIYYDSAGRIDEKRLFYRKQDSSDYYHSFSTFFEYDTKNRVIGEYKYKFDENGTEELNSFEIVEYLPNDSINYEYDVYMYSFGNDTSYTYYYYKTDTTYIDYYESQNIGESVLLDKREIFIYNSDGTLKSRINHYFNSSGVVTWATSIGYAYNSDGLLEKYSKYTYDYGTQQWYSDGDNTTFAYYSDGSLKEKEHTYYIDDYDENWNLIWVKRGEKDAYTYNSSGEIQTHIKSVSDDWVNYTVRDSYTENYSATGCLSYVCDKGNDFYEYDFTWNYISDNNCNVLESKKYSSGKLSEHEKYEYYPSGVLKMESNTKSSTSESIYYDALGNETYRYYESTSYGLSFSHTNHYYTYFTNIDSTICKSNGLKLSKYSADESGTYYDTLTSTMLTDSIIIYNLTVNENVTRLDTGVCGNKLLAFNGKMYSHGIYDSVINENTIGCNDIFRLSVTKYPEFYVETDTTICGGTGIYEKYESGIYYIKNSTLHGCDSTIKLTLNVIDEPVNELKTEYNLCYSDSLRIDLQKEYNSYSWNTGENSKGISLKGEQLGEGSTTLYVDVEKGNCVNRFTSQVNVHPDTPADQCYVKGEDILFYPNPAADVLNVKTNIEISRVDIYDSNNNILITNSILDNSQIDVSLLSTGKYTIKFVANSNVIYEQELIKL